MTFSSQFIEILNALCDKVGITIDWTSSNVLPYLQDLIQRFVKYETYTSMLWLIIGLTAAIICLYYLVKEVKRKENVNEMAVIFYAMVVTLGFFVTMKQATDIIEVNTIPEKTIISYIKLNIGTTSE